MEPTSQPQQPPLAPGRPPSPAIPRPERPLRVLIAPDAFKGSLSAAAAAQAIAAGWRRRRPQDQLELCPLADGGDGFGPVLAERLGAELRSCDTVDAAGRPRRARWWFRAADPAEAIVESAEAIGLALLPPALRQPFALDSRGLAPLLLAAREAGAQRVLLGLGGSATNDGGFGLARALGWSFQDVAGQPLRRWGDLEHLATVQPPARPLPLPTLLLAVDVENPLLGPQGASAIYGPQKGLTAAQLPRAEACLERLASCLEPRDPGAAQRPGSGAAGGLGFGLQLFCGGSLRAGAELVAEASALERRLAAADLVISGEGRFDGQSLMGKGVGRTLSRARHAAKPCLLLVGQGQGAAVRQAREASAAAGQALEVRALVPELTNLEAASGDPALWLERLAERAAAG